jgi:hypothetical protein
MQQREYYPYWQEESTNSRSQIKYGQRADHRISPVVPGSCE